MISASKFNASDADHCQNYRRNQDKNFETQPEHRANQCANAYCHHGWYGEN